MERGSGSDAIIVYPQALAADGEWFNWDLTSGSDSNADIAMLEALPDELTPAPPASLLTGRIELGTPAPPAAPAVTTTQSADRATTADLTLMS